MNLVATERNTSRRSYFNVLNVYIAFDDGLLASYTLDYGNYSFDFNLRGKLTVEAAPIVSIELVEALVIVN